MNAVIDLGTNTFHLLIAEQDEKGEIKPVFRKRIFVKLGENGLDTIGRKPYERGINAMLDFKDVLSKYRIQKLSAIGTAALRTAKNGPDFLVDVLQKTDINVELITGDQEAVWIYKGVRKAVDLREGLSLIMDIGGGSVEFILADERGMRWRQSFPVGLAVLYEGFHHSDPISGSEREQIHRFLEMELNALWLQLSLYSPKILVGAAGAFEIFEHFLPYRPMSDTQRNFSLSDFKSLHRLFISSSLSERLAMDKLPDSRADMIVVAMELINFIMEKTGIKEIAVSDFAMKEGILCEMMGGEGEGS